MTQDNPTGRPSDLGRRAPERRRAAVIDAALLLFLRDGVARTSVAAIAREAGVAKGTVFLYFPSKEHIAQAIEKGFNARILERVRAAARHVAGRDPGAAVEAWCVELVHAYLDDLQIHDMLFYGGAAASRESVADNALVDDLEALLASLGVDDPTHTAAFLVGGLAMLTDRAVLLGVSSGSTDLDHPVRQLTAATITATTNRAADPGPKSPGDRHPAGDDTR